MKQQTSATSSRPLEKRLEKPDADDIRQRVEALKPWFHDLDLRGIRTAPDHFLYGYPASKFAHFADSLPPDMRGMSVLDIGCNAGFYSMEMKRRGANRVLGIDTDERYLAQARLAAEVNGYELELKNCSVYDIASLGERFDLVIFMGVLYHLRHPLLALDLIREHVAKDLLLFQTLQRGSSAMYDAPQDADFEEAAHFDKGDYPKLHFIEHEYAHDWTNWWIPNAACSAAMLRAAGFQILQRPEPEVYICQVTARPTQAGAVYPTRGIA
jgi:tRNA (mo5U34)-methyltransferase